MKQHAERFWMVLPHPIRWLIVLIVGITLIVAGIVFLVLPGPGIPLILLGLIILATEFAWAQIILERVKHHGASVGTIVKGWYAKLFRKNSKNKQQVEKADEENHATRDGKD